VLEKVPDKELEAEDELQDHLLLTCRERHGV